MYGEEEVSPVANQKGSCCPKKQKLKLFNWFRSWLAWLDQSSSVGNREFRGS